jgi:hypothetical protein
VVAQVMGAGITSETSVKYQTKRLNIPEDTHLHTSCYENMKPNNSPFAVAYLFFYSNN